MRTFLFSLKFLFGSSALPLRNLSTLDAVLQLASALF
jgi:hypothetical protein